MVLAVQGSDRCPSVRTEQMRRDFELALPRIQRHAEVVFRSVRCVHRKEDCIAEVVALSWKWWLRLCQRGRNPAEFVSAIATYAARAVRSGRRLTGQERAKDALSPTAQARRGFTVSPLPGGSSLAGNAFDEALADNTRTPVDEQVAFRFDFPAWLLTHTDRNRRIIADMMLSERTSFLAGKYGVCPARVSQLRREFYLDWQDFLGDCV